MLAAGIREAAMTFPDGTVCGSDNVSTPAFARLPDGLLVAFGALLNECKRAGRWPQLLDLVLIVLLAKPEGGRQPIGLFPAPVRIWMRARGMVARAWENDNFRPSLFGGAGRGAQRAAWQVAFQAEAAAASGEDYAQALFDLVKAFEKVPHDRLVAAARRHGYCLTVLR